MNNSLIRWNEFSSMIWCALRKCRLLYFHDIEEFLNGALRKFTVPLFIAGAREFHKEVLLPLCDIYDGNDFYTGGLEIKERTGF